MTPFDCQDPDQDQTLTFHFGVHEAKTPIGSCGPACDWAVMECHPGFTSLPLKVHTWPWEVAGELLSCRLSD